MKKLNLIISLLFFGYFSKAQVQTIDLSETKIGPLVNVSYKQSIDLNTNDTLKYIFIMFRDAKYQYISEYGNVYFSNPHKDTTAISEFVNDLNFMINNLGKNIITNKRFYKLSTSDYFTKAITIEDKDGAYTYISKKNAIELINWIKSLNLQ